MTTADRSANGLPWLRLGVDAWSFGLETSNAGVAHDANDRRSAATRAAGSGGLIGPGMSPPASSVNALVQAVEPTHHGHELLKAVLRRDELAEEWRGEIEAAPLHLCSGGSAVVPPRYHK